MRHTRPPDVPAIGTWIGKTYQLDERGHALHGMRVLVSAAAYPTKDALQDHLGIEFDGWTFRSRDHDLLARLNPHCPESALAGIEVGATRIAALDHSPRLLWYTHRDVDRTLDSLAAALHPAASMQDAVDDLTAALDRTRWARPSEIEDPLPFDDLPAGDTAVDDYAAVRAELAAWRHQSQVWERAVATDPLLRDYRHYWTRYGDTVLGIIDTRFFWTCLPPPPARGRFWKRRHRP